MKPPPEVPDYATRFWERETECFNRLSRVNPEFQFVNRNGDNWFFGVDWEVKRRFYDTWKTWCYIDHKLSTYDPAEWKPRIPDDKRQGYLIPENTLLHPKGVRGRALRRDCRAFAFMEDEASYEIVVIDLLQEEPGGKVFRGPFPPHENARDPVPTFRVDPPYTMTLARFWSLPVP